MPITIDGGRITLRNAGIERIIETDEGLSTSRYFIAPEGVWGHGHFRPTFAFDAHLPFEFAITINGEEHLGGPLAYQPSWGQKRGSFSVVDVVQERGDIGDRVTLVTRPNQDGIPAVEIHVIYELSDDLPFLVKQIRVENLSPQPLVIDNLTVDILKALRLGRELLVTTDYYTYGAAKSQRDGFFASYERFCFASDIHLELAPGERFDSFRCIQTVGPGTADENSVVSQRVLKTLAPWIVANPVHVCVFRIDHIDELYAQVRQRRDDGAEYIEFFVGQLFTNTGDYIPRADLFPGGAADLKRLVGHCHDLGLKVATYCSLTIANHSSAVCIEHPDWQYLGPDGIRYHPEGFGNMCYQSGWGDYIRGKMNWLVDEIGFDGLGIDGPYHGLPCQEKDHRHTTAESVKVMNWDWERRFYLEMTRKGVFLTTPGDTPESYLLGVCRSPGGYTEEDQETMSGLAYVSVFRSATYDTRYKTPACCTWTSCSIEEYHGNSVMPSEEDPVSYEHAIAGMFGYGHSGVTTGKQVYLGPRTKAIYLKWMQFFKEHRATLLGETVHLARPNGTDVDGVMHVRPGATPPALVVLFNPSTDSKQVNFSLPLFMAGIDRNSTAMLQGGTRLEVDSRGYAAADFALNPGEVRHWAIR